MKATDRIEKIFIQKVLKGELPPQSLLSSERELALDFEVGRPVIREVMQRLERDGWLTIRSGKRAVVNDYWEQGNLMTLNHLLTDEEHIQEEFIVYLMELRKNLAPAYTKDAVNHKALTVASLLSESENIADEPQGFAEYDWHLQKGLAAASPNPIYLLMLNSFQQLYIKTAVHYFQDGQSRQATRKYYRDLMETAMAKDGNWAEILVKKEMEDSIKRWKQQLTTKKKGED
ncbi:GntR family transcriptional regulator [Planococcus versutus]|uniref:HTH gntR-type domain-containing protein n=1 Tax=Planococcus versutus TaxID=1302659 RepID=A0A1B1RZF2_9BACL|nr:GntR family transcriptional regulator [Planococcus versutus]ANU26294.1 hypothetical protein I858_004510 [Planococcus versutus]